MALALRFVPGGRGEVEQRGADVLGALAITGGLALLIYVIVKTQSYGWGSARTLILGAHRARADRRVRRHRGARARAARATGRSSACARWPVGDGAMFFLGRGLFANFFFGTLYLQEILHFTPIATGFAFLPVAVLIGVAAGISQRIVPRFGIRAVAIGRR